MFFHRTAYIASGQAIGDACSLFISPAREPSAAPTATSLRSDPFGNPPIAIRLQCTLRNGSLWPIFASNRLIFSLNFRQFRTKVDLDSLKDLCVFLFFFEKNSISSLSVQPELPIQSLRSRAIHTHTHKILCDQRWSH